MARTYLFWAHFLCMVALTMQATDIAPIPDMVPTVLDVDVNEQEDRHIALNGGAAVLSCTDDDEVRVYIQSVTPSNPCGIDCFQLQPCGSTTDYCLYFLSSQGQLSYSQTNSYSLSIVCTDDVELSSTSSLTVNVVSNSPPQFDPAAPLRVSQTVNLFSTANYATILTVATQDVDNDPVTMTGIFNPPTPYLSFSQSNGVMYLNHNARLLCEATMELSVTITDGFHADVGPKIYDLTLNGNLKPVITNLGITLPVPENTAAGTTIISLNVDDAFKSRTDITMTSTSNTAMELLQLSGVNLQLRISPDYERADTRSVPLVFRVNDAFCFSDEYSLTVEITDVNEAPVFVPTVNRPLLYTYEGNVNVPTGLVGYDEDNGETLTYSLVSGGGGEFQVEPNTGNIYSPNEIDIDNNQVSQDYTLTIRVTDKDGLTDDQLVLIRVRDANDQAPYFQANSYTFAATSCSQLGDVLGTMTGDDDDSAYQNNDVFYFGGTSATTAVTSDGQVVLTGAMTDGDSNTGSATITDTGLYPAPGLSSSTSYVVTCCDPCPTTAAPVTGGGTTAAGTTAAATTTSGTGTGTGSGSNSASGLLDALPWAVPALIFGLLWLALTGFLIYRFCFPCRNPCPRRPKPMKVQPIKPPPKPVPPQMKPNRPPKPPTPRPAFKIAPPPPLTPEPEPNPYLFGFWKEKYTDQEFIRQPNRELKPISIEQLPDEGNPPTPPPELRLGPDNAQKPAFIPTNLNAPDKPDAPAAPIKAWEQPKKKSKFCIIL